MDQEYSDQAGPSSNAESLVNDVSDICPIEVNAEEDPIILELQNYPLSPFDSLQSYQQHPQGLATIHCLSNDQLESHFVSLNRELAGRVDFLLNQIEHQIDLTYHRDVISHAKLDSENHKNKHGKFNWYSFNSFFNKPYIRDDRGFRSPANTDTEHHRQLLSSNSRNIDSILTNSPGCKRPWRLTEMHQLRDAVYGHYSRKQVAELVKRKVKWSEELQRTMSLWDDRASQEDICMELRYKINLNEEQIEQIKSNERPEMFVSDDRNDPDLDWLTISATLTDSKHLDAHDCKLMWKNKLHPKINSSPWTPDEANKLALLYLDYGNDWEIIAKYLGTNRLAWQCCSYYQSELNAKNYSKTPISADSNEWAHITEVISMCKVGDYIPWNQVSFFVQSHPINTIKYFWSKYQAHLQHSQDQNPDSLGQINSSDVRNKSFQNLKNKLNSWNHYDDLALMTAVKLFGPRDWKRVSLYIPGHDNRSCRERYSMRLGYSTRTVGSWSKKEDLELMQLMKKFSNDAKIISKHFRSRNLHQIRSRIAVLSNSKSNCKDMRRSSMRQEFQHTYDFIPHVLNSLTRHVQPGTEVNQIEDGLNVLEGVNMNDNSQLNPKARIILHQFLNQLYRRLEHIYNLGLPSFIKSRVFKDRKPGWNKSKSKGKKRPSQTLMRIQNKKKNSAPISSTEICIPSDSDNMNVNFSLPDNRCSDEETIVDDDCDSENDFEWTLRGRRPKRLSEQRIDDKLMEIFSSYSAIKPPSKSLVYRSNQDETIYQQLVDIICDQIIPNFEVKLDSARSAHHTTDQNQDRLITNRLSQGFCRRNCLLKKVIEDAIENKVTKLCEENKSKSFRGIISNTNVPVNSDENSSRINQLVQGDSLDSMTRGAVAVESNTSLIQYCPPNVVLQFGLDGISYSPGINKNQVQVQGGPVDMIPIAIPYESSNDVQNNSNQVQCCSSAVRNETPEAQGSSSNVLDQLLMQLFESPTNSNEVNIQPGQSLLAKRNVIKLLCKDNDVILPPNETTIRGLRGFIMQQEYLKSIVRDKLDADQREAIDAICANSLEYKQLVHSVRSIFLWPLLLSRIVPPEIDSRQWLEWQSKSIADEKSLFYLIRSLQDKLTR